MRVIEGVVLHHTAGSPAGNYPSLRIVRDGRAGLAGPLSQLGLGRDGTVFVIAAGSAYHAGASSWAGFYDLNDSSIGIEAESVGTRDDWTPAQRDCYPRLVAALLHFMRRGAERAAGHREVALPAGRKVDPFGIDLAEFRAHVAWLLADPLARIPRSTPPPSEEDPVQNFPIHGNGQQVLICPTGSVSADNRKVWLSASVADGAGSIRVYAQGGKGGVHDWWWSEDDLRVTDGLARRPYMELRDGVTHVVVHWDLMKSTAGGTLCLETKAQR